MIFIPEQILKDILEEILAFVKEDYEENNVTETESLLYWIFGGYQKDGKLNYFQEAKKLFLRDDSHPNKIKIRQYFDTTKANLPTIHINLPSEKGRFIDGLGVDKGYEDTVTSNGGTKIQEVNTRSFRTVQGIIFTSSNHLEISLMYTLFKATLISLLDIIDLVGFKDPVLGGQDLQLNPDLIPPTIFIRILSLEYFYEISIPSSQKSKLISNLNFIQKLLIN